MDNESGQKTEKVGKQGEDLLHMFPPETIMDRYVAFQEVYKPEKHKTYLALVFFILCLGLQPFLLVGIQTVLPRHQPPLPDLIFMLFGQHRWAWVICDKMIIFHVTIHFILAFFHKYRWAIMRRFWLIGGILFIMRASCLGVTYLTPSDENSQEICAPKSNFTSVGDYLGDVLTYIKTVGLTSGQKFVLCGDLMFSGHTAVLCLAYFTILRYTPSKLTYFRYFMTPVTYLSLFAITLSGIHYTIDVFVSYWLCSHVFWSYHQTFDVTLNSNRKFDDKVANNYNDQHMKNIWWFWIVKWFESGMPKRRMPNELEWPFSWPFICVDCMAYLNQIWK